MKDRQVSKKRYTSLRTDAEAYDLKQMKALTDERMNEGLPKTAKRRSISEARIRQIAVHCLAQMSANGVDDAMIEMADKREAHINNKILNG